MYLVKQVELAIRSHLDDLLRPAGLTALQYTALTVLERHPDLSSAQLARNSFVTAQSMADMITTLEGRGLIERHRDRADRRRLVVALTAAAGNCSTATGTRSPRWKRRCWPASPRRRSRPAPQPARLPRQPRPGARAAERGAGGECSSPPR